MTTVSRSYRCSGLKGVLKISLAVYTLLLARIVGFEAPTASSKMVISLELIDLMSVA